MADKGKASNQKADPDDERNVLAQILLDLAFHNLFEGWLFDSVRKTQTSGDFLKPIQFFSKIRAHRCDSKLHGKLAIARQKNAALDLVECCVSSFVLTFDVRKKVRIDFKRGSIV